MPRCTLKDRYIQRGGVQAGGLDGKRVKFKDTTMAVSRQRTSRAFTFAPRASSSCGQDVRHVGQSHSPLLVARDRSLQKLLQSYGRGCVLRRTRHALKLTFATSA